MMYKNNIYEEKIKFKKIYIPLHHGNYYVKVNYKKTNNNKCIVWLAGHNDYFYHYHFSNYFNDYDIYAISFRNSHNKRINNFHHIDNLTDYYTEINLVIKKFNLIKYKERILYGHSTGGLIGTLYLNDNKHIFHKFIMNSPFLKLKMNDSYFNDFILQNGIMKLVKYFPKLDISPYTGHISKLVIYLSSSYMINKNMKKLKNSPLLSTWLASIIENQNRISNNEITIEIPTLIFFCNKSTIKFNKIDKGDNVIDVTSCINQIPKIFKNYKLKIIKNSIHDMLCSDGNIHNRKTPIGNTFHTIEQFFHSNS